MPLHLEEFAHSVKTAGKTLYLATDVPTYKKAPSDIAARMRIIRPRKGYDDAESLSQSEVEYANRESSLNKKLQGICERVGCKLIPLNLALKEGGRYVAFTEDSGKTIPLYSDYTHVSPAGSIRAARFLMPFVFAPNRTLSARKN
jgi:hypothetical protein